MVMENVKIARRGDPGDTTKKNKEEGLERLYKATCWIKHISNGLFVRSSALHIGQFLKSCGIISETLCFVNCINCIFSVVSLAFPHALPIDLKFLSSHPDVTTKT